MSTVAQRSDRPSWGLTSLGWLMLLGAFAAGWFVHSILAGAY